MPWLDRHTSFGCLVARPPNDEHDLLQERASRFVALLFHAPKNVPPSRSAYPRLRLSSLSKALVSKRQRIRNYLPDVGKRFRPNVSRLQEPARPMNLASVRWPPAIGVIDC